MYYHILIETKEKKGKAEQNQQYFELDKTNLPEIIEDIVMPYLKKEQFQFDGYFLNFTDITRVVIKESERTTKEYSNYENDNMPPNIIMYISPSDILRYDQHVTDITKNLFEICRKKIKESLKKPKLNNETKTVFSIETFPKPKRDQSKVFIVHGHDELAKSETARFLEKLKIKPIILHEQVNSGNTIIEKIENHSNVGYGIVLYTPCDVGSKKVQKNINYKIGLVKM